VDVRSVPIARRKRAKAGLFLAAVLALTVLAAWLRLDDLGRRGFWRDEAQCVRIAQMSFPAGVIEALHHEAHPPLYYSLLHFWMLVVGQSDFRVRLLSVMPGVLTIPLLFWAGRRLFNSWAGLGAALVAAVAPLHVALSQSARGYTWLAFFSLTSVWLLAEAWEHGGWLRWAGYVAATAAAMYTHNWGLVLVVAQNGFALWQLIRRREWKRRLRPWISVQVCLGLLYLPWFFVLLQQVKIISMLPMSSMPTLWSQVIRLANEVLAPWPWTLAWLGLLVAGLWPARRGAVSDGRGVALAALCGFGTLGVGLLVSLKTYGAVPTYVTLAALPALYLLLGRGLARFKPWAAPFLTALIVLISLSDMAAAKYEYRSTLREVAAAVGQEAGPDDMIVIAPDYLSPTFNYYFRGQQAQVSFPWVMGRQEWIDCVGWNDRWEHAAEAVPATLDEIEARLGAEGRLWFIAPLDSFTDDDRYYGQIRRLKAELDARYTLEETLDNFRGAPEWATIYVYRRAG